MGTLTSWNLLGHSRPVRGLLYLLVRCGWLVNATPRPLYPKELTRYPLYRRLSGPQGRSGQVRKISPPTVVWIPDSAARSESPYRQRYSGLLKQIIAKEFYLGNPRSVGLRLPPKFARGGVDLDDQKYYLKKLSLCHGRNSNTRLSISRSATNSRVGPINGMKGIWDSQQAANCDSSWGDVTNRKHDAFYSVAPITQPVSDRQW